MLLLPDATRDGGVGGADGTVAHRIATGDAESVYPSTFLDLTEKRTYSPSFPDGRFVTINYRAEGTVFVVASLAAFTSTEGAA